MPNWCENHLSIRTSNPKLITLLKDFFEQDPSSQATEDDDRLLFNSMIPFPVKADDNIFTTTALWGTKWDVRKTDIESSDFFDDVDEQGNAVYDVVARFFTAWTPPEDFLLFTIDRFLTGDNPIDEAELVEWLSNIDKEMPQMKSVKLNLVERLDQFCSSSSSKAPYTLDVKLRYIEYGNDFCGELQFSATQKTIQRNCFSIVGVAKESPKDFQIFDEIFGASEYLSMYDEADDDVD